MINRQTFLLTFLATLTVSACGGDSSGWGGTVTDSAGVRIVNNPATGTWTAAETPRVEEVLKIGRADGDADYQFGQIAGIDIGTDGTIFVLDQQARNIRAYDAEGVYLRSFGRGGSGPGELSLATIGLIVRGDTVLVPDMGQQRVTRFATDGTVIGSFPIPMAQGISARWAVGPDGRIVQQSRIMRLPGGDTTVVPRDLLLARNAQGEILDTVLVMPIGKTLEMAGGTVKIRFFEAEPVWGLGEDGSVYFAINNDYSIQILDADGKLRSIVRRDVERRPVTESDQTAFLDAIKDLFTRQGLPPAAIEMVMSGTSFNEYYPAFAFIMGGPDAALWVQRVRTAADIGEGADFNIQDMGSPNWDIFDHEGRYLGMIRLPDRFQPLRVLGNNLYGVWRDELDVQYVTKLVVDMGGEG